MSCHFKLKKGIYLKRNERTVEPKKIVVVSEEINVSQSNIWKKINYIIVYVILMKQQLLDFPVFLPFSS